MIERYFEGIVPPPAEYTDADLGIQRTVADAAANADAAIERFRIDEAITAIWTGFRCAIWRVPIRARSWPACSGSPGSDWSPRFATG